MRRQVRRSAEWALCTSDVIREAHQDGERRKRARILADFFFSKNDKKKDTFYFTKVRESPRILLLYSSVEACACISHCWCFFLKICKIWRNHQREESRCGPVFVQRICIYLSYDGLYGLLECIYLFAFFRFACDTHTSAALLCNYIAAVQPTLRILFYNASVWRKTHQRINSLL